jgi:NAD(P)-dependent dehydrogenase (short-subunit alcohol dehydrogenase family)
MKLYGKVAMVTGGNSGIGRATALLFAREGAQVVIAARNEDRGRAAVADIERLGGIARFQSCDVRSAGECQRAVDACIELFSRVDILFNNAGVVVLGGIEETDDDMWKTVMDTNAKGVFLMSRAVIPVMRAQGGGVIVNNASDWGVVGGEKAVAYCASKGAVILMTKAMALDHAREHIRINAVCPGDTYVARWNERAKAAGRDVKGDIASFSQHIPLGRVGKAEEIAQAVLFLASDDSSFMTGATLIVDGGFTAR